MKIRKLSLCKIWKESHDSPLGCPLDPQAGTLTLQAFDIGGHETARRIWRDYFYDVDGASFWAAKKMQFSSSCYDF